ncbi:MAG TPA: pitrilysin family protein, partial [Rhizomicrobium sp.]
MTFILRALTLAMLLASPAIAADQHSISSWPLAAPGLPADPAILFGTLPNGMRYAILHNATPAHGVSLRLLVAAGSIYEKDSQEGIAHFIEHMSFRGTTHVADGDAMRSLQTLGLSPAADADAFTGSDQTKYQFDLPRNDPATIDTGLMLLRETAGEVLFDPKAMDSERPVILAEGRTHEKDNGGIDDAIRQALYGTRLSDALSPIGKTDIIEHATPALLRGFYHAYYQPERAVLLVVGDVDPKAMEERIQAHFADWKAVGRAGPEASYSLPAHDTNEVHLFGNMPTSLYMTWLSPFDPTPESTARNTRTLLEQIGLAIFNDRLATLARHPNPPFLEAQADFTNRKYQGRAVSIFAAPGAVSGAVSLAAVENLRRDLLQNGVRQSEVDEKIASYRTYYQTAMDEASSIPSTARANALLDDVASNLIITSPERERSFFEEVAPAANAASVSAGLRALFTGQGPIVILTSNQQFVPHAQDAISQILASEKSAPVVASSGAGQDAPVVWPYASFGNPGRVVARKTIADLGVTSLRFANGVTVMLKPTKFRTGQILVDVRLGQGQLSLSPKQLAASWLLANSYLGGGLAKISTDDTQHVFAGKVAQITLAMEPDSYVLHGATRPEDLAIQLQTITAFITDAAWRPEALQRARVSLFSGLANARDTPDGALALAANSVLHGGDPRWQTPTFGALLAVTPVDLKALLQPALDGPLSVAMVGDFDPAMAENLL